MKTPVVLVAATLTVAILLAAFLLIATGTRGDDSLPLLAVPHRAAENSLIATQSGEHLNREIVKPAWFD
jgi:hypothetical protein